MSEEKFELSDFVDPHDELKVAIGNLDVPGGAFVFDSIILFIDENCMLIDVPTNIPEDPYLVEGAKVAIKFKKGNQDALNMYSTVLGKQETPPKGYWVEAPPDFRNLFLKRRRHVRVPYRFDFKVFYILNGKEYPLSAECMNLSGGGMRFCAPRQFPMGDTLLLEFTPDKRYPIMKLFGQVVFSQRSQQKDLKYEVVSAVQFQNLIQYQEDQLVGICFRKELEQHRHLRE